MQDPLQQKIRRRSVINGKHCASRLFGQHRVVGTGVRAPLWLEDGRKMIDDRVGIERMTITLASLALMALMKGAANVKELRGIR